MEFSPTPPESTTRHHYSACRDGAPGNPAPSCRSQLLSSIRRSLSPKSDGPNTVCAAQEIPTGGGETFDLSVSSPAGLRSHSVGTQYACEHDPYSQLLSECGCLHYCISVSASHDIAAGCRLSTHHSDTSSPTLYGTSCDSLYVHCDDNSPWCKGSNFYRNSSRRNKLRGFNP